jgi:hypothetical protein
LESELGFTLLWSLIHTDCSGHEFLHESLRFLEPKLQKGHDYAVPNPAVFRLIVKISQIETLANDPSFPKFTMKCLARLPVDEPGIEICNNTLYNLSASSKALVNCVQKTFDCNSIAGLAKFLVKWIVVQLPRFVII